MSKKYSLLFILALLISPIVFSQSLSPTVLASDGDFFTSLGGSVSYTIGEPISETTFSSTHILTQGFQQPFNTAVTGITDQTENFVSLFPNPVSDAIVLNFGNNAGGTFIISIIDITGRIVLTQQIEAISKQKIGFADGEDGLYLVVIKAPNGRSQSFKIIKQN